MTPEAAGSVALSPRPGKIRVLRVTNAVTFLLTALLDFTDPRGYKMTRIAQAQIAVSGWDAPTRHLARDWVIGTVSDFPRSSYSMKDVKRAGELIAGRHPMNPGTLEAFKIANAWREDHAYPMRSIRCQLIWYMRHLELEGVTAARLKRMQAIRRKLTRIGLNLSQLQDLGGCRAVVPKIADVSALVGVLRDRSRHHLRAENDYINNPKPDGYRSHHLMFNFRGRGQAKYYNDRRIEVQIRTRMQHSWATAVEAVGLFRGEDLKGNKGNPDWLRLFKLMSAEFAVAEGCPEPSDVPNHQKRVAEIKALNKTLQATATLENLSNAVRWTDIAIAPSSKPSYYLIKYDNATNQVSVEPFFAPSTAMQSYEKAELADNESGNDTTNIVLVEADKLENMKEAYPNYFGDVQLFRMQLANITTGLGAREFVVRPQETVRSRPKENPNYMWLKGRRR